MNEKAAKLINRITAHSSQATRAALKREWLATPANKRAALRSKISHAQIAIATPTIEDYMAAKERHA
jgi:hypothetical protein